MISPRQSYDSPVTKSQFGGKKQQKLSSFNGQFGSIGDLKSFDSIGPRKYNKEGEIPPKKLVL